MTSTTKHKILFIDDSPMSIEIYKATLGDTEFETIFCASSTDALKIIESEKLSGVITDLIMPEISGIDLLEAVNKHQEDCFKILITGNTDLNIILFAINEIKVNKILIKPIEIKGQEFATLIEQQLCINPPSKQKSA